MKNERYVTWPVNFERLQFILVLVSLILRLMSVVNTTDISINSK